MHESSYAQRIDSLANVVKELQKDQKVRKMVEKRVQEFKNMQIAPSEKWYEELVYCLLTAYSSAELGQRCIDAICEKELLTVGSLKALLGCITEEGHRFANQRAEYIYNTRHLASKIKEVITSFHDINSAREWLRINIKGLGWKESSHLLRNLGFLDVAIIDRHILTNLKEYGLIEDEKLSLTKRRYLKYEKILKKAADKLGMHLGEMDLYLWYRKTGQVLK